MDTVIQSSLDLECQVHAVEIHKPQRYTHSDKTEERSLSVPL